MKVSTWNPFRFRNIAVAALALGIVAGIWLGGLFKGLGFGLGPGTGGSGGGQSASVSTKKTGTDKPAGVADLVGFHDEDGANNAESAKISHIVKVLIDDRSYYVRHGEKRKPISLEALVIKIVQTEPNEDGLKAVVDRTVSSRTSAEMNLIQALRLAGVSDNAVYLSPQAVD
jgi:hypothetical protein